MKNSPAAVAGQYFSFTTRPCRLSLPSEVLCTVKAYSICSVGGQHQHLDCWSHGYCTKSGKLELFNSNGIILVEFLALWSGHCKALISAWEKAATREGSYTSSANFLLKNLVLSRDDEEGAEGGSAVRGSDGARVAVL